MMQTSGVATSVSLSRYESFQDADWVQQSRDNERLTNTLVASEPQIWSKRNGKQRETPSRSLTDTLPHRGQDTWGIAPPCVSARTSAICCTPQRQSQAQRVPQMNAKTHHTNLRVQQSTWISVILTYPRLILLSIWLQLFAFTPSRSTGCLTRRLSCSAFRHSTTLDALEITKSQGFGMSKCCSSSPWASPFSRGSILSLARPDRLIFTRAMDALPDIRCLHDCPVLSVEILCLITLFMHAADMLQEAYIYVMYPAVCK